ncbi:hypothetical protein B0H11DRAFT_2264312 [Mycena galericulata]|nr:hypothetical protein B0H11DRAFT_2264312 [Mycena galericulata]
MMIAQHLAGYVPANFVRAGILSRLVPCGDADLIAGALKVVGISQARPSNEHLKIRTPASPNRVSVRWMARSMSSVEFAPAVLPPISELATLMFRCAIPYWPGFFLICICIVFLRGQTRRLSGGWDRGHASHTTTRLSNSAECLRERGRSLSRESVDDYGFWELGDVQRGRGGRTGEVDEAWVAPAVVYYAVRMGGLNTPENPVKATHPVPWSFSRPPLPRLPPQRTSPPTYALAEAAHAAYLHSVTSCGASSSSAREGGSGGPCHARHVHVARGRGAGGAGGGVWFDWVDWTERRNVHADAGTAVPTTKYARTPDLGTRFPLSESRAPPTNNAAHEIHHIYTASTANDDGPWTPGTLQLLPFYHYNIDSIRQLLSGPLGQASPGNEDLLYAFIPRLHTIARASAPYNNDIEITNLTIAPPKLFRRPAAHRPRASLAPQQTGCARLD